MANVKKKRKLRSKEFDKKFDQGKDLSNHVDIPNL